MIVKNESAVIERCLASVRPIIDYWVIIDTGSTDGTQEIISRVLLSDVPGRLVERPWVDFAHNRNEALTLARGNGDYLFFIDADEQLEFANDFSMPLLDKDAYYIATHLPNHVQFYRMLLVNNHLPWAWEGVLHEALYSPEYGRTAAILPGIVNIARFTDGRRSRDAKKFEKDAKVLAQALQTDPMNSRYVFFLAQSYFQAGKFRKALKTYFQRTRMGGFDEEIYFSYYMAGRLQEKLQMAPDQYLSSYRQAAQLRPMRSEPIYRIAHHFASLEQYEKAFDLIKPALNRSIPSDSLNVELDIYEFGLAYLFIDCAQHLQKEREAQEALLSLSPEKQAWAIEHIIERKSNEKRR
ncbi:MAG: hypothetical protein HW387_593 [Parachlamydiales bacterium]|nr:hypothetical protein [Parachlamydiales bacterium]